MPVLTAASRRPVAGAATEATRRSAAHTKTAISSSRRHVGNFQAQSIFCFTSRFRHGAVPVASMPSHQQSARSRNVAMCSASGPAVGSFPVQDSPSAEDGQTKLRGFEWLAALAARIPPQAAIYSLCAAAFFMWWQCTISHGVAAGALFASATVAAQQGTMVMAAKSAWAGLLAGCLHTLAGADHLAALTPLTIGRSRASSAVLGSLWGLGHSTGQLLLGLLMVLLKDRFNALMPALAKWGGTMVGLTLLAIGIMGIYEAYFEKHEEEEENEEIAAIEEKAKEGKSFAFATFATGIVYGLQPDALFVIIPALALPTQAAAAAYILMFVIGTCAAMGSYTALIGHTTEAIGEKNPWVTKNLTLLASVVAIVIGFLVLLPGWGVNIPFSPF